MEIHFTKLTGLLMIIMLIQLSTQLLLADELNPGIHSLNSSPYGISLPMWTTKWWQWFISIPNNQHPFADTTGDKCGTNQEGPVWYLTGSAGNVVRNCVIPSDKAIFFPILNTECSYSESPELKTEKDLRKCAVTSNNNADLKAILDNRLIKSIDKYRVTSPLFNVTYPSDPVFPTNSNFSQAVSDGWFIMLEPLKPGSHQLKFAASQPMPSTTAMNVTYNIMSK
jgi:hypothetical protein